jgi:hypothetical protein
MQDFEPCEFDSENTGLDLVTYNDEQTVHGVVNSNQSKA